MKGSHPAANTVVQKRHWQVGLGWRQLPEQGGGHSFSETDVMGLVTWRTTSVKGELKVQDPTRTDRQTEGWMAQTRNSGRRECEGQQGTSSCMKVAVLTKKRGVGYTFMYEVLSHRWKLKSRE